MRGGGPAGECFRTYAIEKVERGREWGAEEGVGGEE